MKRVRRNIYFEREQVRQLDDLAARRNVSVSGLVGVAVGSFLSPDAERQGEAAMGRRLDRLTRQFERLERDQSILIETVALFVRHQLSVGPAIPEAHVDAVRAQGLARFEQFVEQLALHLQRGRRLHEAVDELLPRDDQFLGKPEEA